MRQPQPQREPRGYAAVRAMIIGYGVAAFAFLRSQFPGAEAPQAPGGFASSQSLLLIGLAMQALLIAARALLRRYAPDDATVRQGMAVAGLVADGLTVLLFALGTFGAIVQFGREP